MLRGVDARHAVHLLQVGHRPESGEGEKAAGDAEVDDEWRPRGGVRQHAHRLRSATARVPTMAADGMDGGQAEVLGRSRTLQPGDTASSAERIASATNTARQEVCVTIHASGAPAMTAPRLPANIVTPARVAKRSGANQTADSFSIEMKATETPIPTSVRPTAAISHAGASANSSEPAAAIAEPVGKDLARPERIGQYADRNLQDRVDVEVGRSKRSEHGAADVERTSEFAGDRRRSGAMKERQHETGECQSEDDAAGAGERTHVGTAARR